VSESIDPAAAAAGCARCSARDPIRDRRIEGSRQALMKYVALLALFPLGFVLYGRNL
jgi:hypothetical protein